MSPHQRQIYVGAIRGPSKRRRTNLWHVGYCTMRAEVIKGWAYVFRGKKLKYSFAPEEWVGTQAAAESRVRGHRRRSHLPGFKTIPKP